MATIRAKLKQLRDADVKFISLVDRAATRIPFRVLKREKESKMGIDLTGVFKSDTSLKPAVAALVVLAHKNEAVNTQVREAIEKLGFITDRVQKSDEGQTLVYAQKDQAEDASVVRLSDQTLVSVEGLQAPSGWTGAMVEEHGFFPDLEMATEALLDQIEQVAKSDTPQEDGKKVLSSYAEYLDQMLVLPTACYKLGEVVQDIVKKAEPKTESESKASEKPLPGKKAEAVVEKPAAKTKEDAAKATKNEAETEAEKKKRALKHPPAEMAPPDEEDDQKPPPEEAQKCDTDDGIQATLLTALKGIEDRMMEQLAGVSQKVETVVTDLDAQKKVLDDVVQKADTLDTKLGTTVTAPPMSEDRPASTRMRVQKDDDPRTGNFDTAFLRRRR